MPIHRANSSRQRNKERVVYQDPFQTDPVSDMIFFLILLPRLSFICLSWIFTSNDRENPDFAFHLSVDLGEEALTLIVEAGFQKRYPTPCKAWNARKAEIERATSHTREINKRELNERLARDHDDLKLTLYHEIISRVASSFPYVHPQPMALLYDL